LSEELAQRILDLFFVRRDAYGLETPQGWITVKQPVTLDLIHTHLSGGPCLGAHPIDQDNRCRWIGWDFDEARKATLLYERAKAEYPSTALLLNFTGGRGCHLRAFFNRLIQAFVGCQLARQLVEEREGVEWYPKQPRISREGFGSFMRLPLGRHAKTGRVGRLIHPATLLEIKPCAPPVPSTFKLMAEQCQHRVQEARMNGEGRIVKLDTYDCLFSNGTVGSCREDQCPILLRQEPTEKGDLTKP